MGSEIVVVEDRDDLKLVNENGEKEVKKGSHDLITESMAAMPSDISKEAVQQTVYNLILYLPLTDLEVKNGATIEDIE